MSHKYAAKSNTTDEPAAEQSSDSSDQAKQPPAFLERFRRARQQNAADGSPKASTTSAAAKARRFVTSFRAKKDDEADAAGDAAATADSDDDEPKPRKFASGSAKGFGGAIASHMKEAEKKKRQQRTQRSHQLALKEQFNPEVLLVPTQAPPGAPRFYHTLPSGLPGTYFADLVAKSAEAERPRGRGGELTASPSRTTGTDDLEEVKQMEQSVPREFASYWECDEVMKDMMRALSLCHRKGIYNKAMFVSNERVQSLKDVPLKEMAQGDFLWRTWRAAVSEFVTFHTSTALNARYILGCGKTRYQSVGESSAVDVLEGVLVHVWRSPTAAREFITGWQRTWRTVFESRLEGITCPLSAGYRIQGSFVTVTALCPLEPTFAKQIVELSPASIWGTHGIACPSVPPELSGVALGDEPQTTTSSPALVAAMRRYCHSLCVDAAPPLTLGLDGRYYILDVRHALQPTFNDPSLKQRPRLELLLQMRDLRGLLDQTNVVMQLPEAADRAYAEETTGIRAQIDNKVLSDPLAFVRKVGARRAAIDALRHLMEHDFDEPLTVESIVDQNLVPVMLHRSGINLCFLPLVMEEALTAEIPETLISEHDRNRIAGMFCDACQIEMLTRTLKDLAVLDLNHGVTANTIINDIGRRIDVPNRVASLAIAKDPNFFVDHVAPRLRQKFYGAMPDYFVDPALTTAGRLIRKLMFHLGVELSSEQKRFTHFCPIAQTYAMAMRPPKTAELYLSKLHNEIDLHVPLLWDRWRITPTTSPVRHSAFVQASFLTLLCRATDMYHHVVDSAAACVPDFDDDDLLQADVLAIEAESHVILKRDNAKLRSYLQHLASVPREGHVDTPIFAVKYINAATLSASNEFAVRAANALVRMEHASTSTHSATYQFAASVCDGFAVKDGSEEVLNDYLALQREAIKQARAVSVKEAVHTALHCTAVLVAAHEGSAAYSSEAVAEFAREALRLEMEGLGPRNRCTCVGLYHVMVVALRERAMTENSAVKRHLGLSERVLDMLLKEPDTKKIPGMTHSQRSMELIERVVRVLREAGDRKSSVLIRQARESIIKGEIVDAIEEENDSNDSGEAIANKRATSPSMVLSDSDHRPVEMNDSDDDSKLEASLHSPSERRESNASDAVLSRKQSAVAADKVVAPAALHPVSDDEEDKREAVAA